MKRVGVMGVLVMAMSGCASTNVSPLAIGRDWQPRVGRHTGGATVLGGPRSAVQGTWARDYTGIDVLGWFQPGWSGSSLNPQGGLGSY